MAERRMFAKSIVLSDAFLDMPMSARCLYFTLGMLADDDGFIGNPKSIMRQCGASQDDMLALLQKRYILSWESGVIVIKHWRMNNYLQNDRHKSTTYLEEKSTLTIDQKGAYTEINKDVYTDCIQNVYTGKYSIDKYSIDNNIYVSPEDDTGDPEKDENGYTLEDRFDFIRSIYPKLRRGSRAKALKTYKKYITTGHKYCDKNIKLTEKQIYEAVLEYIRQQEEKKTDAVYYKNFETLMNQVSDYVTEGENNG